MRDLGSTFELDDGTYEADAKDTATSSNSSRADSHNGVILRGASPTFSCKCNDFSGLLMYGSYCICFSSEWF